MIAKLARDACCEGSGRKVDAVAIAGCTDGLARVRVTHCVLSVTR